MSVVTLVDFEFFADVIKRKPVYDTVCFFVNEKESAHKSPFVIFVADESFGCYMDSIEISAPDFTHLSKEQLLVWCSFIGAKNWADVKKAYDNITFFESRYGEPLKILAIQKDINKVIAFAFERALAHVKVKVFEAAEKEKQKEKK